jgi:hypothetical protein
LNTINYFSSVPILLQKSARDWAKPAGGAVVHPWLPRAPEGAAAWTHRH